MNEKDRLANFKALLKSEQENWIHLVDMDGNHRLWRELSAEGKLDIVARDAAYFGVTFEQFAEAARESIDAAELEDTALRLAMRKEQELTAVERLFPDDGRTEDAPPLIERVGELLRAVSGEHEDTRDEDWQLTSKELDALAKEIREDHEAAKREDAHWYGSSSTEDSSTQMTNTPAVEKRAPGNRVDVKRQGGMTVEDLRKVNDSDPSLAKKRDRSIGR